MKHAKRYALRRPTVGGQHWPATTYWTKHKAQWAMGQITSVMELSQAQTFRLRKRWWL